MCPPGERPRALLLGSGDKPRVVEAHEQLRPLIDRYVEVVVADFEDEADLETFEADMAIVMGGDGSILRAAQQMGSQQRPVLGVNVGKLGFLADVAPEELERALKAVCSGDYRVVEHLMLCCRVRRGDEVLAEKLSLNEAAVLGGPPYSMLHVDLYVDAELVTTYSCDGLIVSTPVGSTAHSLSAGGPILRKNLQAVVISAISPHTLTVRPVVDTADHTYELEVRDPHEGVSIVVDGQPLMPLRAGERVVIERAKPQFKLLEIAGHSYYRTLREKLGWGGHIKPTASEP